jgi:hypothetical protein
LKCRRGTTRNVKGDSRCWQLSQIFSKDWNDFSCDKLFLRLANALAGSARASSPIMPQTRNSRRGNGERGSWCLLPSYCRKNIQSQVRRYWVTWRRRYIRSNIPPSVKSRIFEYMSLVNFSTLIGIESANNESRYSTKDLIKS